MKVFNSPSGLIKAWIGDFEIEEKAFGQLQNVASMPFIYKWIAVMPDVHAGMGATIGSVIPTINAIMPSAVGVDIGCGMMAAKLDVKIKDFPIEKQKEAYKKIIESVPNGRTCNGGPKDVGAWMRKYIPFQVHHEWDTSLDYCFRSILKKHPGAEPYNDINHCGTLGTGNHFIEICVDEDGFIWVVLHSGSRGPGNKFGSYFINLAKTECEKWFVKLPDKALAYFPKGTEYFEDYLTATNWAQQFADINRRIMMRFVLMELSNLVGQNRHTYDDILQKGTVRRVACHHNYVAIENHFGKNVLVCRKGAIRARKKDFGIIPGSMGSKSYIVRGKQNNDSFHSASHGAGRLMSRTKAKKTFTIEDHQSATRGVICIKDDSVLDETPGSYKDIDKVMEAQKDLVEIDTVLKQVICIKGPEDPDKRRKR